MTKLNDGNDGAGNAVEAEKADPIFEKLGLPFIEDARGNPQLNQAAIAAKCASELLIAFDAETNLFTRYDDRVGLWQKMHDAEVRHRLHGALQDLGIKYGCTHLVQRVTSSTLRALAQMLQPFDAKVASEDISGLVHVANGVLDLRGDAPVLRAHDAKYRFSASAGVRFDEHAQCPRFAKELLGAALTLDDIKLLQIVFGSILLGSNLCHVILLIRGAGGTGKSTLLWILERIIGEHAVAHLRTNHLLGRFESSAFIGKRMLVGSDVPGDTLTEKLTVEADALVRKR